MPPTFSRRRASPVRRRADSCPVCPSSTSTSSRYAFIGAPGSGKTTALVNAGLTFPLAEQFGKAAIRGIGGTRNCDWWFTNEAVLIDTAGRYTTQESNESVDKAEWQGFLALLRNSVRGSRLNGVLLTVSVADLLQMTAQERKCMRPR